MKAEVGDRLVLDGDADLRIGLIIKVPHADGSPPYVVKWLAGGDIALVSPGPYARVIRSAPATPPDRLGAPATGG
jgi:hypothetical protein